ncbi:MAG: TatD family hydrolase [Proteobacteria bacterium]|nr:TatD family deoxyribonuclease [Desulfobacteraceae bacterium]MBU2522486.1 TatD family hydrolase [Pseudomonadota bacterium]MBU3980389.1 TatD family hydrolase [Pseudomonadota bacterium]MBU4014038.1 TatD family hydrolase [Pseudomonadota bacterium]MBU4066856.1 TatD family hydrolase [Pseudomonadota bacterium]
MKLFDSHCHLDDRAYDKDIDDVIKCANEAGVSAIMIVGTNKDSSTKAVALAKSYSGLYASVGIHPHDAKDCSEQVLLYLIKLTKSKKVRAWGEIGLDFNRMYSPRKDQEKWFVRQLEIAGKLDLPVIFHERDSKGRLLEILKEKHCRERKGVIHCFSGNKSELYQYIELGFYIGITGILTIKSRGAELIKLAPLVPADRILVETDAPYLTPAPEKNRTKRNEPAFVKSVLLKLAEARKEDPEYLSDIIWKNTCKLYNLKPAHRLAQF